MPPRKSKKPHTVSDSDDEELHLKTKTKKRQKVSRRRIDDESYLMPAGFELIQLGRSSPTCPVKYAVTNGHSFVLVQANDADTGLVPSSSLVAYNPSKTSTGSIKSKSSINFAESSDNDKECDKEKKPKIKKTNKKR